MPPMLCPKHGPRSPGVVVCKHVAEDVARGEGIQPLIVATIRLGFFAGNPSAPMDFGFGYCRKCVEEDGFPPESRDISEAEFEQMNDRDSGHPVCWKCLEPLLVDQ